ncbi:MAG: ribosome maturation factor RimP [Gammaproteobacteria bacterium]|nr:ribosome maturation factor RimP [Gammaproteobacteria bacterium]MCG3143719.1 Ribosome maturation factor RimP [Gammaproteobacteria bacterium]
MKAQERLQGLLEPVVTGLGYEWVGLEFLSAGARSILRVYIDRDGGISVEDCERVSRQVSAVLDVEDVIRGQYNLEVSSPGLDRLLFTPEHYRRFAGSEVRLQLRDLVQGRRKLDGRLVGIDAGEEVTILADGVEYRIPLANVAKARLKPEF